MGRFCAVRNCRKIPQKRSCHRLPLHNPERLKLWLSFLGLDSNTPVNVLQEADHRVCALHFRHEDYVQSTGLRKKSPRKLFLKRTAVPTFLGAVPDEEELGVTEASSSVAMESQGFRRGLSNLITNEGLDIDLITTDRAPSVRKIMREEFQNIHHEFDPWYVSKGIKKKLVALSNKKENQDLQGWLRSILNHFWFSCSSCGGSAEELKRRWTSVLHHICGEHTWEHDGKKWACPHPALSPDEQRSKRWLRVDSEVFKGLRTIVEDKRLLKDLEQMTHFKHTGSLEVYHSVMLRYMPKRLHFGFNTMVARTQLAILDNNYNVGREQAETSEGVPRFSLVFPKQRKEWVAKKIYEPTSQNFKHHLVERVLERREERTPQDIPHVQQPPNIATKERPPKEDVIWKHQSRFPRHTDA